MKAFLGHRDSGFLICFILFIKAIVDGVIGAILHDDTYIIMAINDSLISMVALLIHVYYEYPVDDDE